MKQRRRAFEAALAAILVLIAVGLIVWDGICGMHVPIVTCLIGSGIFLSLTYFPMSYLLRYRKPPISARRTLQTTATSELESVGPNTLVGWEAAAFALLEAGASQEDPLLSHKLTWLKPLGFAMYWEQWLRGMRQKHRRLWRRNRVKEPPAPLPAVSEVVDPMGYIAVYWAMGMLFTRAYWQNLFYRMRGHWDDRKD